MFGPAHAGLGVQLSLCIPCTEFPAVASGAIIITHRDLVNIFSHRILAMAGNSKCVGHNLEENLVGL